MQKSNKWPLIFQIPPIIALVLFGLTSCAEEARIKRPPIIVPVNLEQEGATTDFILEIQEHLIYEYHLKFKFPENNQVERARVRKLLGGYEVDKFGRAKEPGTPTPLKLIITRIDSSSEIKFYAIEIDPILTSWSADSFDKNIGHCDLPPGKYKLHLENLRQSPELSTIPTYFVVGMDKFKFTFDPKKSDRSKSCPQ